MGGAACSVALALVLLAVSPEVQPDTGSYLGHSPERAPLYPYILDAFLALFGEGSAFAWLARTQAACLIAACAFLATRVGRALALDVPWRHVLFLILALPGLKFVAVILTEPLGYALLVVFWTLLAEEVLTARATHSWKLSALCALGLLLRPQLLFLPALLGVFWVAQALVRRDGASLVRLGVLLLCLGAVMGIRGGENQLRHGSFSTASSGGIHLLSSLLYIAVPADAAAIHEPAAREFFLDTLARAEARHLTRAHWDKSRAHFDVAMERIVFDVVRPAFKEHVALKVGQAGQAQFEDRLAMSAAVPLLVHMPGRYLVLLARKAYDGQPFYYALVVLTGALALAHGLRAGSRPALLFAMAALHSCMSYGVILLAGVYSLRYILPAEAILLALTLAVGRALLVASAPTAGSEQRPFMPQGNS